MAKALKSPAIRIMACDRQVGKVSCRKCESFLGLFHYDTDEAPVVSECNVGEKDCEAKATLDEFREDVDNDIIAAETQRLEQEEDDDDLFDFGDDE